MARGSHVTAGGRAPFTRRVALACSRRPPLVFAALTLAYRDSFFAYPFLAQPESARWPIFLSLGGAVVALVTLLAMWRTTRAGEHRRWQSIAMVAVLVASVAAIVVVRGPRDDAAERRIRARIHARLVDCPPARRGRAPARPRVRVECRDRVGRPPMCAYDIDGSRGGASGGDYLVGTVGC